MQKKGIRRIQLLLLLVVVGLVVWRMTAAPAGTGFVTITDVDMRDLESRSFEVFSPATITIDAEVSFEDERAGSDLAVVAWILDASSGSVMWKTTAENVQREGVRALVSDSVQLAPGGYTAYLSTLGPDRESYKGGSAFGLKPHWTNYESYWYLDLRAPDGTVDAGPKVNIVRTGEKSSLVRLGLRDRRSSKSTMLHVSDTGIVRAHGGITRCASDCDEIVVTEVPSGDVVWSVDQADAEPAGGSRVNHWLDARITLDKGVYEVTFQPGQNRGSWSANPPWNPDAWEFAMDVEEGSVRLLDPWASGEPIVDQLGLGNGEMAQTRLVLEDSLDVILYAMGEMASSRQRYDWGWIETEDTADTIWEMTYENSTAAGGHSDNRSSKAILRLGPGSYVVSFKTDGSHSFEGFNRSRPPNPEQWGMAIFPLDPDQAAEARFQVEAIERRGVGEMPGDSPATALGDIDETRFLVRSTGLGNDANIRSRFTIEDSTRVIIMAVGELTSSSQYDFGWLEDVTTGDTVWEMTWENTSPAGGSENFRQARQEMILGPGEYEARFQTDGTLSSEDFTDEIPDHPEDWGIAIFRADS